jgi:hypothetical protein
MPAPGSRSLPCGDPGGLRRPAAAGEIRRCRGAAFPRYDYVSRTSLGEMTGEILIEKWLELVRKSPAPDRRR